MNPGNAELATPEVQPLRNRFDCMERAGAFGDLGTLIPFVLAYISVMKLDPLGVLLGFASAWSCLVFGTEHRSLFNR